MVSRREAERQRSERRRRAAGALPRAEWRKRGAERKRAARAMYAAGVSARRVAWALGVSRRQIGRYLQPRREALDRARRAVRPEQAEIEYDAACRAARKRPRLRWNLSHERRRAATVAVLLATPFATVRAVARALAVSESTCHSYLSDLEDVSWATAYGEDLADRYAELLELRVAKEVAKDGRLWTLAELLSAAPSGDYAARETIRVRRRADFAWSAEVRTMIAIGPRIGVPADETAKLERMLRLQRVMAPVAVAFAVDEMLGAVA